MRATPLPRYPAPLLRRRRIGAGLLLFGLILAVLSARVPGLLDRRWECEQLFIAPKMDPDEVQRCFEPARQATGEHTHGLVYRTDEGELALLTKTPGATQEDAAHRGDEFAHALIKEVLNRYPSSALVPRHRVVSNTLGMAGQAVSTFGVVFGVAWSVTGIVVLLRAQRNLWALRLPPPVQAAKEPEPEKFDY